MTGVRLTGLRKSYGSTTVLAVDELELHSGQIVALVGENGAGKSTLIKILSADYERDSGEIELFGKPVQFRTPKQAMDAGIRVIYQELNNVPELTVAENISLGDLPTRTGLVDWAEVRSRALETLRLLDAQLDLNRLGWQIDTDATYPHDVFEVFRDAEAGKAHVESEHFKAASSMMPRWLAAVPEIIHVEGPGEGWAPVSEAS